MQDNPSRASQENDQDIAADGLTHVTVPIDVLRERGIAEQVVDHPDATRHRGNAYIFHANRADRAVAQRDRLAAALRHLRHVADERGASSDLWNAIAHEERAKADGVWSPDVWAALREVEA